MSLLERDDILDALRELARCLADAGVIADVRIVGGAALAIEYFDRAATNDVDAVLSPAGDVKAVAARRVRDRGWPEDWLNDKVVMFMSHHDERATWKPIVVEPGVLISVASADLLLALKLLAGRGNRDGNDIERLLGICGVNSIESVEAIFDRYYPQDEIARRAADGPRPGSSGADADELTSPRSRSVAMKRPATNSAVSAAGRAAPPMAPSCRSAPRRRAARARPSTGDLTPDRSIRAGGHRGW